MTGTDVQGYAKRELSDVWVPAQLWIINKGSDGYYTLENPNSRTYLDLRMFPHDMLSSLASHTHGIVQVAVLMGPSSKAFNPLVPTTRNG